MTVAEFLPYIQESSSRRFTLRLTSDKAKKFWPVGAPASLKPNWFIVHDLQVPEYFMNLEVIAVGVSADLDIEVKI